MQLATDSDETRRVTDSKGIRHGWVRLRVHQLELQVTELKLGKEWRECPHELEHLWQVVIPAHLEGHCMEWTIGRAEEEMTDGSVTEKRSGLAWHSPTKPTNRLQEQSGILR